MFLSRSIFVHAFELEWLPFNCPQYFTNPNICIHFSEDSIQLCHECKICVVIFYYQECACYMSITVVSVSAPLKQWSRRFDSYAARGCIYTEFVFVLSF